MIKILQQEMDQNWKYLKFYAVNYKNLFVISFSRSKCLVCLFDIIKY